MSAHHSYRESVEAWYAAMTPEQRAAYQAAYAEELEEARRQRERMTEKETSVSEYEELDSRLRAWLAEDEALARACLVEPFDNGIGEIIDPAKRWPPPALSRYSERNASGEHWHPDWVRARVPFITAHGPTAVLADIAGKLALLDHLASWPHEYVDGDTWFSCSQAINPHDTDEVPGSGCADEKRKGKPCDCGLNVRRLAVLRCVAAGYVERDGFQESWRIDG